MNKLNWIGGSYRFDNILGVKQMFITGFYMLRGGKSSWQYKIIFYMFQYSYFDDFYILLTPCNLN